MNQFKQWTIHQILYQPFKKKVYHIADPIRTKEAMELVCTQMYTKVHTSQARPSSRLLRLSWPYEKTKQAWKEY